MDNTEIKEILSGYRPGTEDDHDPSICKALEEVANDPELEKWLDRQLSMDITIKDALLREPAPESLLENIIEFGKTAEQSNKQPGKWLRFTCYGLGIAACLILSLGFFLRDSIINNQVFGYYPSLSSIDKTDSFREAMSMFVNDTIINLDQYSEDANELNQWLADHGEPVFAKIPEGLDQLPALGCKRFLWKGQKVSLICFHIKKGQIAHLFILDNIENPKSSETNVRNLVRLYDLPSQGWTDSQSNKTYMVVGSNPEVDLEGIGLI